MAPDPGSGLGELVERLAGLMVRPLDGERTDERAVAGREPSA